MPENDVSPLHAQPNALELLRASASLAPTYVSLGNHEWMLDEEDLNEMRDTGAIVLDNAWIERDGLVIGGLTSGYVMRYRRSLSERTEEERAGHRYPSRKGLVEIVKTAAEIIMDRMPDDDWLVEYAEVPGFHVLLSHHPEYRQLVPMEVELMLSGHAHGGQFRLPLIGGLYAPGQGVFPEYDSGVYTYGHTHMIVSRGIGQSSFPLRFNNRPELVIVTLDSTDK
jgi:predicted MPP superfamily phosphohydrolase